MAVCSPNPFNFTITWVTIQVEEQEELYRREPDDFVGGEHNLYRSSTELSAGLTNTNEFLSKDCTEIMFWKKPFWMSPSQFKLNFNIHQGNLPE